MQTNVVLLSFEESSKAYQALSELKQAAVQGKIGLNTAAVVERNLDGSLKFGDGASDGAAGDAALAGTAIGALVGVLGGPLGVLMLGATGGFLGSLVSLDTVETRTSLLEQMSHAIPPGAVSCGRSGLCTMTTRFAATISSAAVASFFSSTPVAAAVACKP